MAGLTLACILALLLPLSLKAQDHRHKSVLLLVPFETYRPVPTAVRQGLETVLRKSYPDAEVIAADLADPAPPFPSDYQRKLIDWLGYKYGGRKFDAICALQPDALSVAEQLRNRWWPGTPVVFGIISGDYRPEFGPKPGTTGVLTPFSNEESVKEALRLLPDTLHIALVGGASPSDRLGTQRIRQFIRDTAPSVDVIDLAGLSIGEITSRVASLPERTFVFLSFFSFDREGRRLTTPSLIQTLSRAANRPLFFTQDIGLGHGLVGGPMYSPRTVAEAMGDVVVRLFGGEVAQNIPVVKAPPVRLIDWRQLERWGIPESRIAPGTEIRFRSQSLWERYRLPILLGIVALLLESLLIAVLLVERRRRRHSERATASSETLGRAILASLSGRIAVLDRDGRVLRVSGNWPARQPDPKKLFARARPRHYPALWPDFGAAAQEDESIRQNLKAVLEGAGVTHIVERHERNGMDDRWFEVHVEPLVRPEGGAIVTQLEITSRKKADFEHRQALGELQRLNHVAALGQLAASLAHELSQPLAAILMNAESAERFAAPAEPDLAELREALADITSAGNRAGTIIDRMQLQLRKQAVPSMEVDVNRAVEEVIRLVYGSVVSRSIELRCNWSADPLVVCGDLIPLQQVVLNLINNGMDAIGETTGSPRMLSVRTVAHETCAEILVEDSGPGIPGNVLPRLFEPFYTTKQDGLGMGLSICRSIVEAMGGQIGAENRSQGGAALRVLLPLVVATASTPLPTSSSGVDSLRGLADA